jgi:phage head maturation protease
MQVYAEIVKIDPDQRMVWGYASTVALDSQGERISKEALEEALPDYMRFANLREMHQPSAVGVAKEATIDDQGMYLAAKVVDEAAWEKVKEGVYKGFSIGGRRVTKVDDTITALKITEVSLVDRPANPECTFDVFKAEDVEPEEDLDKVAAREDVNPKAGEKEYGDVEFADAKNKKYPIDTEAHIRSAWNYINKPGNAAKYSDADVKSIKAKIVAAWKKKIDKEGPPSAKAEDPVDLAKFLGQEAWDATLAMDALRAIYELISREMGEDHPEAAQQVTDLKAVVDHLKAFIASEIMEEDADQDTSPVVMAEGVNAQEPDQIAKARLDKIQGIHDHAVSLGANCGGSHKMKTDNTVEKKDEAEDLTKRLSDLEKENLELKEKVSKLEAQPAPAKGQLRVVSKADDVDTVVTPDTDPVKKADGTVDQDATALKLMKVARSTPVTYRPGS